MISALTLLATISSVTLFGQDDALGMAGGIGGICCTCAPGLISLGLFVFNIFMAIDAYQHESKLPESENQAILWILVCLFAFGIGGIIYYFVRRPKNRG